MLTLLEPKDGETVSLAAHAQEVFRTPKASRERKHLDGNLTFHWYALEADEKKQDRSQPAPVHFAWDYRFEPVGDHPDPRLAEGNFFLIVSEKRDLSDPIVTVTAQTEADVWNLKIGTRYYFCVQREGKRSEVHHFRTAPILPRCIRIDGIYNVRDSGGYPVPDGRIRQGLLFRGGELERHMHLTRDGADALTALGIRTDLDLRGEAVGTIEYPLLPLFGIRSELIPIAPYDAIFEKSAKRAWRRIFHLLADRDAYPVYHHCWGGADRGGTLAFLVGAILGMSENALDYEYEYTSLSRWGLRSRNYPPYVRMKEQLRAFPGDTLAEQTASFLTRRIGVPDEELRTIRDILIEPKR